MDCLFCRVAQKKLPSKAVYENERVYAFEDISPQAPVHVLLIPKKHISTVLDLTQNDNDLIGHLFHVAKDIARKKGIGERGFRLVMNCNPESGQTIYHIHLHLLGGRIMHWPPG